MRARVRAADDRSSPSRQDRSVEFSSRQEDERWLRIGRLRKLAQALRTRVRRRRPLFVFSCRFLAQRCSPLVWRGTLLVLRGCPKVVRDGP